MGVRKVESCEVIRDKKTGDSLQYAFVEFDCPEACERAYFKMDNVLIDDRRIHVDFSQSVSQYRRKGKGRIERDATDLKKEKERSGRDDKDKCSNQNRDRNRDRSVDRKRDRSRDRRRDRSRERRKDRSRDRSRDRDYRRDHDKNKSSRHR